MHLSTDRGVIRSSDFSEDGLFYFFFNFMISRSLVSRRSILLRCPREVWETSPCILLTEIFFTRCAVI